MTKEKKDQEQLELERFRKKMKKIKDEYDGEEDFFEPCTALEHRFQFPDAIDGLEYPSGFLLFFGQFEFPILHSHGPFLLPFSARRKVLQRLGLRSIRPPSFSFFGSPRPSGAPERLAACLLLLPPYSEGNSEANLQG